MPPLIFERRELNSWADFVRVSDLKEGTVYFRVHFCDDDMLIPLMEPMVFVGRNLEPNELKRAYFQDVDSYTDGVRYDHPHPDETEARLQSFPEKSGQVMAVYEFEAALEELMRCSLNRRRRQTRSGSV